MSPALSLETSGRIGSVALSDGGNVLVEEQFSHGLQHAAKIVTVIDALCRSRHLKPSDLSQINVSIGPGSFTGLRIGITLAKTMALATGAKIVAVPTVRVLLANATEDARNVVSVLDAKREQIFTARFERIESDWIEREPAHLDRLADVLARSPRPVHLLGEGLPYHEKFLDRTDSGVLLTDPALWRGRAGAVAKIGWEMSCRGEFTDPAALRPLYVRKPEAEEKFDAATSR